MKELVCKICDKQYKTIQSLCNHNKRFHNITKTTNVTTKTTFIQPLQECIQPVHFCSKCNKNFKHYNRWIYEGSSSGRVAMWKESIKYIIKSPIYGYGPLADRIIIKENISNIYFYSLLCGGMIGFAMIVLVNLIIDITKSLSIHINTQMKL